LDSFVEFKKTGLSDSFISSKIENTTELEVRSRREELGLNISIKQIDTLAGEYPTQTNYLYTTYHGDNNDTEAFPENKTIIVLGSGTYKIGSSVEFDYCSVKCMQSFRAMGYKTIMINYNPETISTDFDNCDKLYFEELNLERVIDIYKYEKAYGIVVSMGGQEPNNIALDLYNYGLNIIGTSPKSIDTCEDRNKYSSLLDKLSIQQPAWLSASSKFEIKNFINNVKYPVLIRPSYVLSGAAMHIVRDDDQLLLCLNDAKDISPNHPVVITKFVEGAIEVDMDTICNNGELVTYAISEHLENAGVHSGDATLILPPHTLSNVICERLVEIAKEIGKNLNISGLFNTQFLVKDDWIGVIETNLRASRSIPFVSKTYNIDFIDLACKAMINEVIGEITSKKVSHYCVKCPQFSFTRLPEADPILGVEMKSTGEVACFGQTVQEAYIKSLVASRCGLKLKKQYTILRIDNETNLENYVKLGYTILQYDDKDIDWSKIDIAIDCSNSKENRKVRRNAIDFSVYLITNKQQVQMLSESLNSNLRIDPYSNYKEQIGKKNIKLFVRQGFTQSNEAIRNKIQLSLDNLSRMKLEDRYVSLSTGYDAESRNTFKINYEILEKREFNPTNFRESRLSKMSESNAFLILRTGMSESTVFEIAYNILKGKNIPIFVAIDGDKEIKTTLIRDLDGFENANVTYKNIESGIENLADDPDFQNFIQQL
jgi:carbamoyl-phosphate synthase large subunit